MNTKNFKALLVLVLTSIVLATCGDAASAVKRYQGLTQTAEAQPTAINTLTPVSTFTPTVSPTPTFTLTPEVRNETLSPKENCVGILEGTKLYEAKHVKGELYQLTGETKLAKADEYCNSGQANIDDVDGRFLGAYRYGLIRGQIEDNPNTIWIVGHN